MFAGFKIRKITMALILFTVLIGGSLNAATLDPLLQGLIQDKAAGLEFGLNYENFLVVDYSKSSSDPMVAVILYMESESKNLNTVPGLVVGSRHGRFMTARLPMSSLSWLEADEDISHVEAARLLHPLMDAALVDGQVDDVWAGSPAYTGAGTLVGVIDSGIDWTHADFNAPDGQTRIKYIWDQFTEGTHPAGFGYGAEYNENQINAGTLTEVDANGHGSHVSGIAAGNGFESSGLYSGVAPEAGIIFAKAFSDERGGFPEDKVIDALNYMAGKAEALGQPMAVNLSLGGHMGPHDGTTAQEQIMDDLSGAGLVFCVAAGNEGARKIHDTCYTTSGSLTYNIAADYTPEPGEGNDYAILDMWIDGDSSPSVTVSIDGHTIGPVQSGLSGGNSGSYGTVVINNAVGTESNGDKQIIIQFDDQNGIAPSSGDWTITFNEGSGRVHAWIATSTMYSTFPNSIQSYSVSIPGTSESAITVAAHITKTTWTSAGGTVTYPSGWGPVVLGRIAPFSSVGPTRDGREKPDLSAPGMGMFAPFSAQTSHSPDATWMSPDGNYLFSQGTSMATPFVTGVAALMFEKNSTLTAAQIKTALRESAATDSFTGGVWNETYGAGKVDALAAVQAVSTPGPLPTGDVNNDETTSVLDLVLLANHIADPVSNPLGSAARIQGDVYPAPMGDGLLNVSDLVRIVSFILETDLPGFAAPSMDVVNFEMAQALWQDGHWWQPITIQGNGLAAGQFALNSDDAVWQPEDLVCDASVQLSTGVVGGQLRVLFYDLSGNSLDDEITMLVPFGFSGEQPVQARTAGILMVDSLGEPLSILETTSQPAGFLKVSPNPSVGHMNISFARESGRSYGLSVFDLRGRLVRRMTVGHGEEGNGNVVFDGRDDSGHNLSAGIYFVRLSSEGQNFTQKIILTR